VGIEVPAGIEIIQQQPLFRRVGMEGKGPPPDIDLEVLPQLFNTPGTEIAPGSDIIRKDVKNFLRRHTNSPIRLGRSLLLRNDGEIEGMHPGIPRRADGDNLKPGLDRSGRSDGPAFESARRPGVFEGKRS
jgi:hypothetical protein